MSAPFYNAIKGTTAGTPGTGAFTPNAASSGFLAWSTVPTGWIGLVRYEDGSDWELQYSYWSGTTLSRSATAQFVSSSTGSALTLTSSATAAMVVDGGDVQPIFGGPTPHGWIANTNSTTVLALATAAVITTGTAAGVAIAATNYLTEQIRVQITSATTANAQAGWSSGTLAPVSTTAGRGGFNFIGRFGASQLPTGPRLFVGMSGTTFVANTGEPSAFTDNYAVFAKDSTDTNIQLLVNSNAGSGTKTDTGIALVANGWYEASIWCDPGSNKVYSLLVRLDTGAIWYGFTTTDVPSNGSLMRPLLLGGLNGTNTGTAFILHIGQMLVSPVS